jgi:hypothetical protein
MDLDTWKNFKLELIESLAIQAPPAPCITHLSIEALLANKPKNIAHMCLPKEEKLQVKE